MIFLRRQNLIFLKTRKTAGTSLEVAFSTNAGPRDILTPISGKAEAMRMAAPFRPAQNWADDECVEADYLTHVRQGRGKGPQRVAICADMAARMDGARVFANHSTAARVRQTLGRAVFDRAQKVTAVRHPYEVVVSHAWMSHDPVGNFAASVDRVLAHNPQGNFAIYSLGGKYVADHFIRYEHLHDDIAHLEQAFGLSLLAHLPMTKHKSRLDRSPAKNQLTPQQRRDIQTRDDAEFALFGHAT